MQQQALFSTPKQNQQDLPVTFIRNYLSPKQQQYLIEEAQTYPFHSPEITVYGKTHKIPRCQVWFADKGCDYVYSNLWVTALAWPYHLSRLRQKLRRDFQLELNGVLVNKYADGNDCMGWHCDDEVEIEQGSDIVSISLGTARDFHIKHKQTDQKISFNLQSGDLLIMHWPMQQHWLHSVPKRKNVKEPRYNLTYRKIRVNAQD
ncbi:MAG: alpha-ketoglutarate-dependent dioxygenase AlkB family protein [Parashewanella sp.]